MRACQRGAAGPACCAGKQRPGCRLVRRPGRVGTLPSPSWLRRACAHHSCTFGHHLCALDRAPDNTTRGPQALGRPASLRQVARLVESVAGSGACSLRFGDFAQVGAGAGHTSVALLAGLNLKCPRTLSPLALPCPLPAPSFQYAACAHHRLVKGLVPRLQSAPPCTTTTLPLHPPDDARQHVLQAAQGGTAAQPAPAGGQPGSLPGRSRHPERAWPRRRRRPTGRSTGWRGGR